MKAFFNQIDECERLEVVQLMTTYFTDVMERFAKDPDVVKESTNTYVLVIQALQHCYFASGRYEQFLKLQGGLNENTRARFAEGDLMEVICQRRLGLKGPPHTIERSHCADSYYFLLFAMEMLFSRGNGSDDYEDFLKLGSHHRMRMCGDEEFPDLAVENRLFYIRATRIGILLSRGTTDSFSEAIVELASCCSPEYPSLARWATQDPVWAPVLCRLLVAIQGVGRNLNLTTEQESSTSLKQGLPILKLHANFLQDLPILFDAPLMNRFCGRCHQVSKDLGLCRGCLKVWYCGDKCASDDWYRAHQLICERERVRGESLRARN